MDEDFDYEWIIFLVFFAFFFILPIVVGIRKAMKAMNASMAKNATSFDQLMAAHQAELKKGTKQKNAPHKPTQKQSGAPQAQLSTAEQKRRAAERKRAKATQTATPAAPGRFTTQAEIIRNLERETASLEAGKSLEATPSLEAGYDWSAQTSLESTSALDTPSLEADQSEGRSLLVDLEKAKAEDFAEPSRRTQQGLAQRLRHPHTLRDVIVAGEIFRRPE